MKSLPDFSFEKKFWQKGIDTVVGLDEVGRGSLAGPVTIAAVSFKLLNSYTFKLVQNAGINDSKKLSHNQREKLAKIIKRRAHWSIASSTTYTINNIGIVKATEKAARKAIKKFPGQKYLLADGFKFKYVCKNQTAIARGDQKSISIAAASIIAKVHRDKLMQKLNKKHPQYNWYQNKGYGTADHIKAIRQHGVTNMHRKQYVRKLT